MAENISELLKNISVDYREINNYLVSGDLLTVLNSASTFSPSDIHSLLSSFNQYKTYTNNINTIKDVFILIFNSTFIHETLEPLLKEYVLFVPTMEDIQIVMLFFINCLQVLPNQAATNMTLLYPCILFVSQRYTDEGVQRINECLKNCLEQTKAKIEHQKSLSLPLPLSNNLDRYQFRNNSVLPQFTDLFPSSPNCGEKFNEASIVSVDDYLERQFYLLKEAFVGPLRDSINGIKDKFMTESTLVSEKCGEGLYENAIIEDLYPSNNELVNRVLYDVSKGQERSIKFTNGSLMCFTNNFFETVHFASVVDTHLKDLSKGFLKVRFNDDPIRQVILDNNFSMIDTGVMSDDYQHALTKLQNFTDKTLPFSKYLVFGNNENKVPTFMKNIDLDTLSSSADGGFDNCEKEAFVNGLSSKLCLVRGGPSTGKTYVCLKMIENIISRNISPILVVCYTEDSLDKFLLELIPRIGKGNVTRIGEPGKHDSINECNISRIKWDWVKRKVFPRGLFARCTRNRKELEIAEENLIRDYMELMNCPKRLVSLSKLIPFMKNSHVSYFEGKDFNSWINDSGEMFSNNYSPFFRQSITEQIFSCINDVVCDMLFEVVVEVLDNSQCLSNENDGRATMNADKSVMNLRLIRNMINKIELLTEGDYNDIESLDVEFNTKLRLYKYWFEKYRSNLVTEYEYAKINYENINKEKKQINSDEYYLIMKDTKVITMTTSSAAQYSSLLDRVGCQVVIVEDASSVPECHVICCLSKSCQQLIMIGDDKRFDGNSEVDLGVPLFQRLIVNNFKSFTLTHQYEIKLTATSLRQLCNFQLSCGHSCQIPCSKASHSHQGYKCNLPCFKKCARGIHQCKLVCSQRCQCEENTTVTLKCGHTKEIICSKNERNVECTKLSEKLLDCGHTFEYCCGLDNVKGKCYELCEKRLSCDHICQKKCVEPCLCEDIRQWVRPCGHTMTVKCGTNYLSSRCDKRVQRQLICGHFIDYKCYENATKCDSVSEKQLTCGHLIYVKCGEAPRICRQACSAVLACHHNCSGICGECSLNYYHRRCNVRCMKKLNCGRHQCDKLCHDGECLSCPLSHGGCSVM